MSIKKIEFVAGPEIVAFFRVFRGKRGQSPNGLVAKRPTST